MDSIIGKPKTDSQKGPMHGRAHFNTVNPYDAYESNICKVFNVNMLSLIFKAIYSLLEDIRVIVMNRIMEDGFFAKRVLDNLLEIEYAQR